MRKPKWGDKLWQAWELTHEVKKSMEQERGYSIVATQAFWDDMLKAIHDMRSTTQWIEAELEVYKYHNRIKEAESAEEK